MNRSGLLLLGAGGHAAACIDVIERHGEYEIVGLVGRSTEVNRSVVGYRVIACDETLPDLVGRYPYALVAVGQIKSPDLRIRLFALALAAGFKLPVITCPTAYVSPHATLGAGTIVMHGAIVNAGARVGDNCIINSNALVEHGVSVGDHCHISTGAIVNGDVRIGDGSFVGSAAVIRESVTLGECCVIGMGAIVRRSQGARQWISE